MRALALLAAVPAIALSARPARASGPVAVYALIDKVSIEPAANKPERIRISGVFITAEGRAGAYSGPQRGYLYFSLPAAHEDLARNEWADLESVAGTRQVVGFGTAWSATAIRVRRSNEEAKDPDEYPLGNGVIRIHPNQPRARALLDSR